MPLKIEANGVNTVVIDDSRNVDLKGQMPTSPFSVGGTAVLNAGSGDLASGTAVSGGISRSTGSISFPATNTITHGIGRRALIFLWIISANQFNNNGPVITSDNGTSITVDVWDKQSGLVCTIGYSFI